MAGDSIVIRGARVHNLKNIDLRLPRNALIVFTGVSGSGKSSLAFDTLYAEGQRRYVESLSSYARQFLGQAPKPDVDYVGGLSPAIAIEQKSAGANPRSTVATITEINDYLRVLYARVGRRHCHLCGREVGAQTVEQMVQQLLALPAGTRLVLLAPLARERKGEYRDLFERLRAEGFARVRVNGRILDLRQEIKLDRRRKHNIELVLDRLTLRPQADSRLAEALEAALERGDGVVIAEVNGQRDLLFSQHYACLDCGVSFEELTPQMFSFNSPQGMCPDCAGLGTTVAVDPRIMVPDEDLSIREGAVRLWGNLEHWKTHHPGRRHHVERAAEFFGIDLDQPWRKLPQKHRDIILLGSDQRYPVSWRHARGEGVRYERFEGALRRAERGYRRTRSPRMKRYWASFLGEVPCPTCGGARLRPESAAVRLSGVTIPDFSSWSVQRAYDFLGNLRLSNAEWLIAAELVKEIRSRLQFLLNVGLHYLTLDRPAPSLSGGESQRIRLASQIGCGLSEVLYILDEPSVGLHQRDHKRLLHSLRDLRDLENTVIVVEHDRQTMETADYIVDFGPGAGERGGEIVVAGPPARVQRRRKSLTAKYLRGDERIPVPARRRTPNGQWLSLQGVEHNNLKRINVDFPLGLFVCVTGVSGSGKSSLVNETLVPALAAVTQRARRRPGRHRRLLGADLVDKAVSINQKPIGRTPRSNPATYVKAFDPIRHLLSQLPEARARGYKPGRFSFNVPGGRCETCRGNGQVCVPMHLLPDIWVTCEDCRGSRFQRETLDVRFKGKNVADILDMTVAEALNHFENQPKITRILQTLDDVGLGYVKLGQPAPTLSGGEAQRVKLAKELCKIATGRTLYVLDEPTTGLHFEDIKKLLRVLQRLVEAGNTVIVIEHNLDVIKVADYLIDLGPEGGEQGGYVVATGTPEQVAANNESYTGRWLRRELKRS